MVYQLGWFSTGRDKAASDLLKAAQDAISQGEISAEIAFVFSNREPGEARESDLFFRQVKRYRIPIVCFSYQKFKAQKETIPSDNMASLPPWRLEYDREIMRRLEGFHPDLCVLAGYMLIVGKEMCTQYRMLNLHPAAPGGPTGAWQEVIWQLMGKRAKETGVMMHLATPELDKGPVVTYCTFSIRGEPFDRYWQRLEKVPLQQIRKESGENDPLFKLIRKHGLMREFPLIISTLKAFSEGKVKIADSKVVDGGGKVINGYDLTEEIDKIVSAKE